AAAHRLGHGLSPLCKWPETSLSCEPTNVLKFAEVARWNDRDCCGVGAGHVGDAGPGGAVTTIERRPNIVGLLVALAALVAGGVVWVAARSSGEGEAVASTVWAATSTVSARVVPNSSAPTAPATTVVV